VYRLGKVPRSLLRIGEREEARHGKLGKEYGRVTFDKEVAQRDGVEWVTPGHPLFDAVRLDTAERAEGALRQGTVLGDPARRDPALLDVFRAAIRDGRGQLLHERLFLVETGADGEMKVLDPAGLFTLGAAPSGAVAPDLAALPHPLVVERHLYEAALAPWLAEVAAGRRAEIDRVQIHVQISLDALIDRAQNQLGDYLNRQIEGAVVPGLDGLIAKAELHLDELNARLEARKRELELERQSAISGITHLGRAWVVPVQAG
jgi:hypothetical protein